MADDKPAVQFEAAIAELELIVKQLENGELTLDQSMELFERGVTLSEACRKQLEGAEAKIEVLTSREGRIETEPFTEE